MFIKLPYSRSIRKSVATGQQSTNYRAEAYTMFAAAQTMNKEERLPTKTVFMTDCRSILQSFQSPGWEQIFNNIKQELSLHKNKTPETLQWTPLHCGAGGNKEADRLSKMGSKLEQSAHPMSYSEAKAYCTYCHTEIQVSDQTFYLTKSQHVDIGLTRPSTGPLRPGARQCSDSCANF